MNCPFCLAPCTERARFCVGCGARLSAQTEQPAGAPPAPQQYPAWQPLPVPKRPWYKRWWFVTLLVITLLLTLVIGGLLGLSRLVSEGHVQYEPAQPGDHALVGRWDWDMGNYSYIFRADGTGSRGFNRWFVLQFAWRISSQGDLEIEYLMDGSTHLYQLTMTDHSFTIRNRQSGEMYTYLRRSPVVNPLGERGTNVALGARN